MCGMTSWIAWVGNTRGPGGREKPLKPTGGVWNDVMRDVIMTSCVEPSRETGGREKRMKPTGGENL